MRSRDFALSIRSTDMASRKKICYISTVMATSKKCLLPSPYLNSMSDSSTDGSSNRPSYSHVHFQWSLMGAGFDKPANTRYFALRFPRGLKIHDDRSFKDTVSFEELQEMARRCREAPEDSEREETHWLGRLGRSGYLIERSRSS
jgi:hypothetical protein